MQLTNTLNISLEERPQYRIYVYLYDFIGAAVKNASVMILDRISKAALHGIQSIFPPSKVASDTGGKGPISIKKLQKGGALWIIYNEILGFLVDGKTKTVKTPNIKSKDMVAEIQIIPKKKPVKLKQYRRIIRNLRYMATILPGTKDILSPINN